MISDKVLPSESCQDMSEDEHRAASLPELPLLPEGLLDRGGGR